MRALSALSRMIVTLGDVRDKFVSSEFRRPAMRNASAKGEEITNNYKLQMGDLACAE